jgi:hypothetical protein
MKLTRLALVLPSIISQEQRGFIKGRHIRDCICLTSEAINMLHKKSYGGNLAIKIDIAKAFDTIDWQFLLKVLNAFGFSTILKFAKLSISINGKQEGFFECTRGVRQGDPLSPLPFCLAKEVLSRGLTKLVEAGQLKLIEATRTNYIPSHILYANDVMFFCKGTSANIQTLFYKICSDIRSGYQSSEVNHICRVYVSLEDQPHCKFVWFQYWFIAFYLPRCTYL